MKFVLLMALGMLAASGAHAKTVKVQCSAKVEKYFLVEGEEGHPKNSNVSDVKLEARDKEGKHFQSDVDNFNIYINLSGPKMIIFVRPLQGPTPSVEGTLSAEGVGPTLRVQYDLPEVTDQDGNMQVGILSVQCNATK